MSDTLTTLAVATLPLTQLASAAVAPGKELLLGAITGLVFGFLLQRGGVTRYSVIAGQFLLKDFTVLKVMLTAIVVGAIGVYGMRSLGMEVPLHLKTATLWGNLVGGLIFGVGMVVLGYCPGTGVAALGDGSRHAIPGLLGMVAGAAIYAELHPWFRRNLLEPLDLGKVTLYGQAGVSVWVFVVGLAAIAVALFITLERWGANRPTAHPAP